MSVKISIIMPLYNSAPYMSKSIESILNQSMKEFELIMIDDKSPDNSYEIALEYKRKYPDLIKVIQHDHNTRAGGARNDGMKAASGEYIWFVDPDDWLDLSALEKAYHCAKSNEYDIVSVDYYAVDDEKCKYKDKRVGLPDEATGDMDIEKQLNYMVKVSGGFTKLIKRSYIIENHLLYPENIMFEDNGIVPLIGSVAHKVASIHEYLYYYRIGNLNSQTQVKKTEQVMLDRIKAMDYMVMKARELGVYEKLKEGLEYLYVNIAYMSIIKFYITGEYDMTKSFFQNIKTKTYHMFPHFKKNTYIKASETKMKLILKAAECGFIFVQLLRKIFVIVKVPKKYTRQ